MKLVFFTFRLVLLGVIGFFSAFLYFIIASHYVSPQTIEHPLSMMLAGVVSTLIFLRPVNKLIEQIPGSPTFQGESKSFKRIKKLAYSLLFEKELVPAANLFINSLAEEYHLYSCSLFLKREDRFLPAAFHGHSLNTFKDFALTDESPLIKVLSNRPQGLKGIGPKEPQPKDADSLSGELHRLRTAYLFPLFDEDKIFGFISLGFKKESHLTRQEIRFVRSLLSTLSAAFYVLNELDDLNKKIKEMPGVQANMAQTAKYSAMEQLATGIAHEIHNPLTIISGKAQVLLLKKSKNFNNKQVEEVLQTIVNQTKRASDVTRKLLMFTKSGKAEKEPLDLETVLKDTLSLISYQISLDQVNLEKDISPNLPKFTGNQGEVREIFMNLVLNAFKATPEKGRVRITLRDNNADNKIEFCVEDSGKGISKEDMDRIFDPFYTSAHENTGLGLYITERLVYKNGGRLTAESEEGKGSLFIVELPYQKKGRVAPKKTMNEVV